LSNHQVERLRGSSLPAYYRGYTQVCQNRHSSIDNQPLINLFTTTKPS